MQTDKFFKVAALGENRFNQENVAQIELARAEPNGMKPDVTAMPDYGLLLIPMGFMMVWTIVVLMSSDLWTVARHGMLSIKHLHQVPCRNCRFYKNNPYLQCAVHPSMALTAEATNCSDYLPQQGCR
jgi:hypothetical protein